MNVRQLIRTLKKCPPDAVVLFAAKGITVEERPIPGFQNPKVDVRLDTKAIPVEEVLSDALANSFEE
jgi:hypothetical protein